MKSSKMERREADLNFVQKQEARSSDEDLSQVEMGKEQMGMKKIVRNPGGEAVYH